MSENPKDPSLAPVSRGGARKPVNAGGAAARDDRLKAALKANMARRKAQTKARRGAADGAPADTGTDTAGTTPDNQKK